MDCSLRRTLLKLLSSGRCWLWAATLLNLAAVLTIWRWVIVVTDDWWFSSVLQYLPRLPLAVPSAVLVLTSIRISRSTLVLNGLSSILILIPVMQWNWPAEIPSPIGRFQNEASDLRHQPGGSTSAPPILRIASCNVVDFAGDFPTTVAEIRRLAPDVVVFQESRHDEGELAHHFGDWHTARHQEFWIGSRFPTRIVRAVRTIRFGRWYHTSGVLFQVDHPSGPVLVFNVHQLSARPQLMRSGFRSLWNGTWAEFVREQNRVRRTEAELLHEAVNESRGSLPLIVLGDFNMPTSSATFRRTWSDWTVAFEQVRYGYGYTALCRDVSYWPDGFPWLRIDHMLIDDKWRIREYVTGSANGSDHRLIFAELEIRNSSVAPPPQTNSDMAKRLPTSPGAALAVHPDPQRRGQ